MSSFVQATREKAKLKMCLAGPSGAGKSYTALVAAHAMIAAGLGKKIAVIESEAGKINKYAGYNVHGQKWDFSVCVLQTFGPGDYVAKIEEAHRLGFDIIILDSISHEWQGKGGALETVDKVGGNNKFAAGWKTVTPLHNNFIDTVLRIPAHIIATCRLKMGYVLEEQTNKEGRTVQAPKKIGLEPIQRNGIEYEFEIYCSLDTSHILRVEKTICPMLDGKTAVCPGPDFFAPLFAWLGEGVEIKASEYQSSMVSAAKLEELMLALRKIGANLLSEKDWILKKFGVDEWSHLNAEQFAEYWKRLELLTYSANQAAIKLAAAATTANPAPIQATAPVQSPSAPPVLTAPALDPNRPIPDQAPSTYGLNPLERCKTLFEELRNALEIPATQAASFFKAAVLDRFSVPSAKDLTEAQLVETERAFMTKLRKVYQEKGMEGALPF